VILYYTGMPRIVQGTVSLNFRGIEKHEYPSGRKFSVEDFRGPDLLIRALGDAGFSTEHADIRQFAARVYVNPLVPGEIQARWRKQDKDGTRREEYFPNEFEIGLNLPTASNNQRIRLFDAMIDRYRERIKFDQKSALGFVAPWNTSYETLAQRYDFWDIPGLFAGTYQALAAQIDSIITESQEFHDSTYQLAFRDIFRDLNTWEGTRLEALEALTYQGRLVKNRDLLQQRVQYQIQELETRIRQKSQEAEESLRLIEAIERPKTLLAGQLNRDGMPLVDVNALDKLLKTDYVGPVVQKITKLQSDMQAMKASRERLERQLTWLPKATNVTLAQLPPGHKELIQSLTSELDGIVKDYNRALDGYLQTTITSLVVVQTSPIVSRLGYSLTSMMSGVVALSLVAAVCMLLLTELFRMALQGETGIRRSSAKL
jgi:hypothetical protein